MQLKSLNQIYYPILLTFIAGRVVLQTDLVMVAKLGMNEMAAFSLPSHLMLIDTVCAFALASVTSVFVANTKEKQRTIEKVFGITFGLGILLAVAGVFIYPKLIQFINVSPIISKMAQGTILWMTVFIPVRMSEFVGSIALHALGKGSSLFGINVIEIIINGILNYFLMFVMNLGFIGCFIGTCLTSLITLAWTLFLIKQNFPESLLFAIPDPKFLKDFLKQFLAELMRISSEQIVKIFILLIVINYALFDTKLLAIFTIAREFQFFLLTSIIALMRASAIFFSSSAKFNLQKVLKKSKVLIAPTFFLSLGVGILIMLLGVTFTELFYNLEPLQEYWWRVFCIYMLCFLHIKIVDAILRGFLQARKQFDIIAKVDIISQLLVLLPSIFIVSPLKIPWLFWGVFLFYDICAFGGIVFFIIQTKYLMVAEYDNTN